MGWNNLWQNRWTKIICSFILLASILAGLGGPGITTRKAGVEEPVMSETISEITELTMGEGTGNQSQAEQPEDGETEEEPKESQQPKPIEVVQPKPDSSQGDEGQDDGLQGEEGGEEMELDLAMVMTWYKYGTHPKTIVCGPSETVAKTLNVAQLSENQLKYNFTLNGKEADYVRIESVKVKAGDSAYTEVSESGQTRVDLPEGGGEKDYTFQVTGHLKKRDAQGNEIEQDIVFTYILHCHYALDLELELHWDRKNSEISTITCIANDSAARTIESHDLTENVFSYTPELTGALAEKAQIVKAEYSTASGEQGALDKLKGSMVFKASGGTGKETYYLTFEVQMEDEETGIRTIYFRYVITYIDTLDIKLAFTWLEKGASKRMLLCQPDSTVSFDVKNNQLSAGALKYEIDLIGNDSDSARILSITYTSDGSGGGKLEQNGSLIVGLPDGFIFNTYKIMVLVLSGGRQIQYEICMTYRMDVTLEMHYQVKEDGKQNQRTILCENGKTTTAEAVYDDQLKDGILNYEMELGGSGSDGIEISEVSCYQSGSKKQIRLDDAGQVELLLKEGKTGENAFTVKAQDREGKVYEFRINIPYKHRGEKLIRITTNMTEGQVVTNETNTNLSVNAWSEDASGNIIQSIPANGTDTKLIVQLDGETLSYVSTSGSASEFIMYPKNPETGDRNTHTLYIYAEDSFGNYGETVITLQGQRNQAGQKKGKATIYVDLSVLGLGVVDSVSYDVLADEPISYAVVKAVMGMDTGEPFGAAVETMGWRGRYTGTLDIGFYLQSLTPGQKAAGLKGSSWNQYGTTEEEILEAIDQYFGRNTGLATLWRCVYRNGLNKSSGFDGEFNEFDYTSGSGWLFSLDGTYYPGQSMSDYRLEDGDILTLRYTLAYGWDVGSGTPGYGNNVGYCVTAMNGSYYVNHQMEVIENSDGSRSYVCHCCGLVEGCVHEHTKVNNLGDGTHVLFCEDCQEPIGNAELHTWVSEENIHTCSGCGATEEHQWKEVEGSNTAACTQAGVRTVCCRICALTKEEESPAKGHSLDKAWKHTKTEHYQQCSECREVIEESRGRHQYVYHEKDNDWYCKICEAGHDWDYCGNQNLTQTAVNCQTMEYICGECGLSFIKEGNFTEYHSYQDGYCIYCHKKEEIFQDEESPSTAGKEEEPALPEDISDENTQPAK